MNKISFDGRLAADAELRYTNGGDAVLSFRVASDIGFGDKKTTNWFQCQVWGKRAEAIAPMLTKGLPVTVYGALTLREYDDKNGQKRTSPGIRVDEITMQGKRDSESVPAQNSGNSASSPKPERVPAGDFEDDIPF